MEALRDIVVLIHIVGFALTFGAWAVEVFARRARTTRLMSIGIVVSLVTGLALAAPWPAGIELDYVKIGVKLLILIALGAFIGIGSSIQRKKQKDVPAPLFWGIGVLSIANAAIAVLWH